MSNNTCIKCAAIVPEGRQVCPQCEVVGMTILRVDTDPVNSTYTVTSHKGSSVNEIAFAVHVTIKTLVRDGHVKNLQEFEKLVRKYYKDSQYAEVTRE